MKLPRAILPPLRELFDAVPAVTLSEKTKNYEIGAKGDFFDHAFSVDASVYYIDFTGLQNEFYDSATQLSYVANPGAAKSKGVELMVEVRPTSGLKIASWVVFSDAHLTGLPAAVQNAGVAASAGDQLPDSSRFSGNLSVDEQFSVAGAITGFVGGTLSYVGKRESPYSTPRLIYPAYARTDLRAAAKYDAWMANFYINNVTDRRGAIF
jgi:iron complex outermembrane receptor protein